jgi:hypothetical protein
MAIVLLLVTSAIGWQEVSSDVLGNEDTGITPYDIVLVFLLTLIYVANSIAASGFVRYLAIKVIRMRTKQVTCSYTYIYRSLAWASLL